MILITFKTTCYGSYKHTPSSTLAYERFLSNWDQNRIESVEQFKILVLSTACQVLGIDDVSTRGVAGLKLIFSAVLNANVSGNLKPSEADITFTREIMSGGKILDITALDLLIITPNGYYSFQDEGRM